MEKRQNIAFRRVRGRIVPIKISKTNQSNETAKGAALTGAGIITGATSGDMAARATKQAAKFRINSNIYTQKAQQIFSRIMSRGASKADKLEKAGQIPFAIKIKPLYKSASFERVALKQALKAKGFVGLKKGLRYGGLATSTALIGTGLKKIYEGTTGQKADTKAEVISTAAGAGATFALSSAYAHRLLGGGKKNLAQAVRVGLRLAKARVF